LKDTSLVLFWVPVRIGAFNLEHRVFQKILEALKSEIRSSRLGDSNCSLSVWRCTFFQKDGDLQRSFLWMSTCINEALSCCRRREQTSRNVHFYSRCNILKKGSQYRDRRSNVGLPFFPRRVPPLPPRMQWKACLNSHTFLSSTVRPPKRTLPGESCNFCQAQSSFAILGKALTTGMLFLTGKCNIRFSRCTFSAAEKPYCLAGE
jgi:hypothetical protein